LSALNGRGFGGECTRTTIGRQGDSAIKEEYVGVKHGNYCNEAG
jgi:hypothetical protein